MAGINTQQPLYSPVGILPHELCVAFDDALKSGNAGGLVAALKTPEGEAVPRNWDAPGAIAAAKGATHLLRVCHEFGFALNFKTWAEAAKHGHVNCLAFAVSHGYDLPDGVLATAVRSGHLGCVEFLLQQGLPSWPYTHYADRARPDQLKCIQLMLDKEVAVDPQTLIFAAVRGDLDFVRWLHQRGFPLWDQVLDTRIHEWDLSRRDPLFLVRRWHVRLMWMLYHQPFRWGTLYIPWDPHGPLWKTLRYGAVHGAPINKRAKRILEEKRQRTRAVIRCFKAAARLCQGPAGAEKRHVWASMAALPPALVEELLIAGDLEIAESVLCRAPLKASAVCGGASSCWVRGGPWLQLWARKGLDIVISVAMRLWFGSAE